MPGTATVAFLFVDLVGSTDILTRIGDDANDEVRRRYIGELRGAVASTVGVEVKNLGDGMMVAFERSVADAVSCGIEMQRAIDRLRHADPLLRLQIRVGISVGEASSSDRDWHGTPVVEAARLESKARPGQILANDVIRQLLGNRGGFECTPVGDYELKGFTEPLACCEIAWEPDPGLPEVPLPAALYRVAPRSPVERPSWNGSRRRGRACGPVRAPSVLITGEPGVGKTRLVAELAARRARGRRVGALRPVRRRRRAARSADCGSAALVRGGVCTRCAARAARDRRRGARRARAVACRAGLRSRAPRRGRSPAAAS